MFRAVLGLTAALAIAASPALAASGAGGGCDERCLLQIAGQYMDSMTGSDPSGAPFAANVRSTENGVVTPLTEGLWKTGSGWGYRHTFVDVDKGEIGAFGTVREGPDADALVALRLKVADRRITESELLVARKGDHGLFEPRWTAEAKPQFKTFVPADRRSTRAELEAVPMAYFKAIMAGDPALIAVHPDAVRFENGVQTTSGQTRAAASISEGLRRLVYMQSVRQVRVPVVDIDRGLVFAVVAFDMPSMEKTLTIRGKPATISSAAQNLPRTLILYELFKVEGGLITGIEAVMRNAPLGADVGWPQASR